jgi:HD-like signal output (HDOD) protein
MARFASTLFSEFQAQPPEMNLIRTDKLKPGQILAAEVRDSNGRLLLAGGREIQPEHIRVFKIWGVCEVLIHDNPCTDDETDPVANPEMLAQILANVQTLFRFADLEHPAIRELFDLAVAFRTEVQHIDPASEAKFAESPATEIGRKADFLEKVNQTNIRLPEIPSIVFELNEVIANPKSSAQQIADVIAKSPSLTAILLKVVNSSFYGFPTKISRISHAVVLIGSREISALALGISVLSIFKHVPVKLINMDSFLKHSLACGTISRILAAHKNLPQTEEMFVSGLLHDLGRLILYVYFPQEASHILGCSRLRPNLLYQEETDHLGCTHAQIGERLMSQWNLPHILRNNVACHHSPLRAQQPMLATIVHLADIITKSLGIGSSGEQFVPPLDRDAWQLLELSPGYFKTVTEQAIHQINAIYSVFKDVSA